MSRGSVESQAIASEADAVGYLATTLADWESNLDPLTVQKALDLLAASRSEAHFTLLAAASEMTF